MYLKPDRINFQTEPLPAAEKGAADRLFVYLR